MRSPAGALRLVATAPACCLLLGLVASVVSAPRADAQGYTREIDASVGSAWVFRGVQRGEANVTAGGGLGLGPFYGGARFTTPVGGQTTGLPNETRFYAGFAPTQLLGLVRVDLGAAHYSYSDEGAAGDPVGPVSPFFDQDRTEAHVGLLLEAPLSPALYGYYDVEGETLTVEASLAGSVPLGGLRNIDLDAVAGHVSGEAGDDYAFAQAGVDIVQSFGVGVEAFIGAHGSVASETLFISDVTAAGPTFNEDAVAWATAGLRVNF